MIIEIDVYPVDRFIKALPEEIEKQISIRGKNYKGVHHYILMSENNNMLQYVGTYISTTINVEKQKEK